MDLGAILCGRAWGANPESDLVFDGKAESAAQDVADPLNLLQVMLAKGSRSSPAFLKRFRRVFVQRFMPGFLNGTTSKARGYRALQTLTRGPDGLINLAKPLECAASPRFRLR